jgi:putative FmdB family regulatory protein
MPVYDYLCDRCGPFTALRPMAESGEPLECPNCRHDAPRAYLTAPYFATMSSERRLAHATNERSAHAPPNLAAFKAKQHGAGCACCGGKSSMGRKTARGKNGAKSFPGSRPWMISH